MKERRALGCDDDVFIGDVSREQLEHCEHRRTHFVDAIVLIATTVFRVL